MFFKPESPKDLLFHLLAIVGVLFILVFIFFNVYLPITTKHNESVRVPKLQGMSIEELEDFLEERKLRYQINDSTYVAGAKPNTILTQHPLPGSSVKENRRIYVTITSKYPPKVKMPKLQDLSLRQAEMIIKGLGMQLGQVSYAPFPAPTVIKQSVEGKEIPEGDLVYKGSKVDLVVGNGTGAERVTVPTATGLPIDEAKLLIAGQELSVGIVKYEPSDKPDGIVIRQNPIPGGTLHKGENIDLVVSGKSQP